MGKLTRRQFVASTAAGAAASVAGEKVMAQSKQQLIHAVFFWLKRPDSDEDRQALIAGLKTLEQ
ncbi:MAG: twin-arginine translocation signal domain-containing protein, partial [Pseudomonadales bacterium]